MRRNPVKGLAVMVGCAVAALGWHEWSQRPRVILERLKNPVSVASWDSQGLTLADGRRITLRGVPSLPTKSAGLVEALREGVEIGEDGDVHGLVRVHHWCGNDPVNEHVARVSLSKMLVFLGAGPVNDYYLLKVGGTFSGSGWRVDEYGLFRKWCSQSESDALQPPSYHD